MGRNNSSKKYLKKLACAKVKAIENNPHIQNKRKEIVNMVKKTGDICAINNPESLTKNNCLIGSK